MVRALDFVAVAVFVVAAAAAADDDFFFDAVCDDSFVCNGFWEEDFLDY